MGKSMRHKGGRGGKAKGGRGGNSNGWRTDTREIPLVRKNAKFEDYYNNLGVVDEEEQEAFWSAMRSDLPNSFRFTGSRGHALTVQRSLIERYIPQIISVEYEGQKVSPPEPVEWYPSRLAWQMTTPKNVIRRFPPFAAFQKFLVSENSVGNITRQEIVSMIPPLFMDVQPGMTVLDLCAAPGSKSAQLIEMVHGGEEARLRKVLEKLAHEQGQQLAPSGIEVTAEKDLADSEADYADCGRATGLLVANDKEYRRAQMLVHQTKRLNSPNIVVTNHDATVFPSLRVNRPGEVTRYLKFDRILADVPCSGDGTTRKNVDVWKNWTYGNALGLHATQVRILCRALQMLKVGGRVVYSTCSLNPIENEAVIAEALDMCGGLDFVEIVNTSSTVPDLKRREGLRSWSVYDKSGNAWNSWDNVLEEREKGSNAELERMVKGFFPPAPEEEIPLHRAIRVYPHLQDTGGFFVCVLEKKTEIKVRMEPSKPLAPKSEPTKEDAPISATVNEIQNQTEAEVKQIAHLKAADSIPDGQQDTKDTEDRKASAKRELETDVGEEPETKKLKIEGPPEPTVANETQERKVHYPPPPSNPPNPHPTSHGAVPSFTPATDFAPGKKKRSDAPQEEAFKYMPVDHPEIASVYDFYAINERFPRDRFMVRNASGNPAKAIYYTSELARDILVANEGKGIKFVHSGVKMFVKQDTSRDPEICKWRVQNEGLPIIEPWINKRTITLRSRETLHRILLEMFPRVGPAGDAETAEKLGEIAPQVQGLGIGCCILRVEPDPESKEPGFDEHFSVPLWRGVGSINLMLPKEDRKAMLLRLFNDDSDLVDTHRLRQKERDMADAEAEEERRNTSSEDEDGGVALPPAKSTQAATVPKEDSAMEVDARAEAAEDAEEAEVQHAIDTEKVDGRGEKIDPDEDLLNKTV